MNTNQNDVGNRYWLAWFLASLAGYFFGMLLGASIAYGLFQRDAFDSTMGLTLGIVMGAAGGFAQWLVLRKQIIGSGWWILASVLGFATVFSYSGTIASDPNPAMAGMRMAVAFSLVTGGLQWAILRDKVAKSGWLVLANFLGLLAAEIGFPISIAVTAATGNENLSMLVVALIFAAGYGAVTGIAMVWLLQQPQPGNVEGLTLTE